MLVFDFVYACRRFNNWTSINSKSIQQAVKEVYRKILEMMREVLWSHKTFLLSIHFFPSYLICISFFSWCYSLPLLFQSILCLLALVSSHFLPSCAPHPCLCSHFDNTWCRCQAADTKLSISLSNGVTAGLCWPFNSLRWRQGPWLQHLCDILSLPPVCSLLADLISGKKLGLTKKDI